MSQFGLELFTSLLLLFAMCIFFSELDISRIGKGAIRMAPLLLVSYRWGNRIPPWAVEPSSRNCPIHHQEQTQRSPWRSRRAYSSWTRLVIEVFFNVYCYSAFAKGYIISVFWLTDVCIITLTDNYVFLVTKVYFKLTLFCHRKWNVYN